MTTTSDLDLVGQSHKWHSLWMDGPHTIQSLYPILRGQINLRFSVPRYIIKLSSDFRTAIRQRELLLPFLEWASQRFLLLPTITLMLLRIGRYRPGRKGIIIQEGDNL